MPCAELITEVTDESGSQQLAVTDTLQKLRVDRDGVPIDLPETVEWGHVIAPAFQQRKVVGLMEDAQQHLRETLDHLEHEREENPELSESEHEAHKAQLAQQAATLHGRLAQLTEVAQHADAEAGSSEEAHLEMSARELQSMHAEVEESRLYSESQRSRVLALSPSGGLGWTRLYLSGGPISNWPKMQMTVGRPTPGNAGFRTLMVPGVARSS